MGDTITPRTFHELTKEVVHLRECQHTARDEVEHFATRRCFQHLHHVGACGCRARGGGAGDNGAQ